MLETWESAATRSARRLLERLPTERIDQRLSSRWIDPPTDAGEVFAGRLARFRCETIPWLNRSRPLEGANIVEVGTGTGASTYALAEQGAKVIGLDLNEEHLAKARLSLNSVGLDAELRCANATDLDSMGLQPEWIIFWAVLEHMTIAERIECLQKAWQQLGPGGLMTVIETPNRLWPYDSHTSLLPFYSWLPDDLAFDYSRRSLRKGFGGDTYLDQESQMMDFLRRGRGVSFHEFDLAIGTIPEVQSCLQIERRRANPLRGIGWWLSAGRAERGLRGFAPEIDQAWFQPFLYLTFEKPDENRD